MLSGEILEPFPFPSVTKEMSMPVSVINPVLQIQTAKYKTEIRGDNSGGVMFRFMSSWLGQNRSVFHSCLNWTEQSRLAQP